ncbi:hypothetical protein HUN42_00078 [Streptomyces phage Dagobah]|nr:hypothetical protein HUN42_00078 [Streptomyces phage Dagobah]
MIIVGGSVLLVIVDERAFVAHLKSRRSTSEEEVTSAETVKSITRGEYLNHHLNVHHVEESRH